MNEKDKVNILMVDDQPGKLMSYETILSGLEENLIRASSGKEALEHLLKTDVAVLLVDVSMPDLDGFELAGMIREHPRYRKTAIIFVSAIHFTEVDRLKGYQLGAVDYVSVPVIPEILRAKVSVFIDLYRKTQQLEHLNRELELRVAERTAALGTSEERFRLATEAMRGGLYDWDIETNTLWRSAGLVAIFGYPADEHEPHLQWWLDRVHPDDLTRMSEGMRNVLESSLPAFDTEYRVQHREGPWVWVWDRGRVVRDNTGRARRVVGHIIDVSMQKDAELQLKQADHRKDEFLAALSHELRNPLAPIRNAVNVMRQKGPVEPDFDRSRDIIDRQVSHLSRLVDDLLDVSRISRNRFELRKEKMELSEAVSAAIEASRPLIDQQCHTLIVSLPPQPVHLEGDLVRLTQVFTNLLNNSAKYTPPGGRLSLNAHLEGSDVVVRVKDNGVGIPPESLHQLFQMFYRALDLRTQAQGGLGVGLTLVARLVELHGGTVEAHSAGINQGSELVVRLPVLSEPVELGQSQQPASSAETETATDRRILVADDNLDSAESLALLLSLKGYEVRTASDGVEAVETAAVFLPDIVFLDIGMPNLNGYEAARMIREQPGGKHILLIALTGWGKEEDRRRCKAAGFDVHLTKPMNYEALLQLLAASPETAREVSKET